MYPSMYQIMYVEKNFTYFAIFDTFGISIYFPSRSYLLDEIGGAQKEAASSSMGPPNDRGVEIGTIPNKLAFLLGTTAVSQINY